MNFNALVSRIQTELNDFTTRIKTRIEKWVNEGHYKICQDRAWNFLNVKYSDKMTFGASDFPIDIETDIDVNSSAVAAQSIIAMYDVTDDTWQELILKTAEQIKKEFDNEDSQDSPPYYYYYVSDHEISVFPPISADRDFKFSFKKKLSTYASGAVTALLIPDKYVDVLFEYVMWKAYRYKTDDRANQAFESYSELLSSMVAAEADKTGIITVGENRLHTPFPRLVDNT